MTNMLAGKEKVARSMDREINNQELELVAHERLPGLRFYVTQLKYCEFHVHIDAEFGLLLDGHAKVHTMQKDIQLKRGDFFYFNFLEAHEVTALSENLLILGIQYSASILNICDTELSLYRVVDIILTRHFQEAGIYRHLYRLMLDAAMTYFGKEDLFALHCMSLTNEILYLFLKHTPVIRPATSDEQAYKLRISRLKRILAYLDQHYMEHLTITELAASEHLSVSRLSHFFQEMLHMSFQTCLAQKRFSRACELLSDPACTVTKAAFESGFSSTRYLNRMMQEHLHMSAAEYQKLHRTDLGALHYSGRKYYLYTAEEALEILGKYLDDR